MNMESPRWASERSGSVRASSRSTSARAAKVHQVFTPLTSQPPSIGTAEVIDAGHVGPEVGLGHGDGAQHLGGGQLREPVLLLLLGAAVDEGPGEDLGPGDQRAADARASPSSAPRWPRPCPCSRSRRPWRSRRTPRAPSRPKPPIVGHALDDLLGDVACWPGACARRGGGPCSSAKRWKVSRTSSKSAPRWRGPPSRPGRPAKAGSRWSAHEGARPAPSSRVHAPSSARARRPGGQVGDGVGDEGAGDAGLDVPVRAVGEDGLGRAARAAAAWATS